MVGAGVVEAWGALGVEVAVSLAVTVAGTVLVAEPVGVAVGTASFASPVTRWACPCPAVRTTPWMCTRPRIAGQALGRGGHCAIAANAQAGQHHQTNRQGTR